MILWSFIFLLINATAEIKITIIMIEDPNRINRFMCDDKAIKPRFSVAIQTFYISFTSFYYKKASANLTPNIFTFLFHQI